MSPKTDRVNTKLYDAARKHVTLGVTKMLEAGATMAEVEYAVASGVEDAGNVIVNVIINTKEG